MLLITGACFLSDDRTKILKEQLEYESDPGSYFLIDKENIGPPAKKKTKRTKSKEKEKSVRVLKPKNTLQVITSIILLLLLL